MFSRYRKLIVALFGAAVLIIGRHYGVTSEWYQDLTVIGTAFGVWAIPNSGSQP